MKTKKFKSFLMTFVLFLCSLMFIFPFYSMFMMATYKTENLYSSIPVYPSNYTIQNFQSVISGGFLNYYWNSLYIAVLVAVGAVFLSALTGFALTMYEFKLKKFLTMVVLVSMMIPMQCGLVAFVLEMRVLGWTNSHWGLVIPYLAYPFGVYWMSQYLKTALSPSLVESARIDGCRDFMIFVRIVLPNIKPAIITLLMMSFLLSWNNYLVPLILLNKTSVFTLPLGIKSLGSAFRTDHAARIMGLAMGTIPIIILFSIGSKYFIRGLTAGAVKE